jgi:hypothetical protein
MFVVSTWAALTVDAVQLKWQRSQFTECLKDFWKPLYNLTQEFCFQVNVMLCRSQLGRQSHFLRLVVSAAVRCSRTDNFPEIRTVTLPSHSSSQTVQYCSVFRLQLQWLWNSNPHWRMCSQHNDSYSLPGCWEVLSPNNPEIIDQIDEVILEDCCISAKSTAELLGISRERVGSIIHEDLEMLVACFHLPGRAKDLSAPLYIRSNTEH